MRSLARPIIFFFLILTFPTLLFAVPMTQDPGGFLDLPWKISLDGRKGVSPPEGTGRVKSYQYKLEPMSIGAVPVTSIRLVTIDGKFARAVVRYEGNKTHHDFLVKLQRWFGPLDRTPGQLGAGTELLQQQFTWRGEETEINVMYDADMEQGVMYVDCRALAPEFNQDLGGQ